MFVEEKSKGEVKELDEPSKALLKAAALIEKHGWCQNHYSSADGRLCILGAVKAALGIPVGDEEDVNPIAEKACERIFDNVGVRAHFWNDRAGRTQDEVVAKLRAVALGG